jgi:hypothetical protein
MGKITKNSYVSPPEGVLEITVIRDANPRVEIALDLGIPNFTVFSLKLPLVEDEPRAMSGLIAEAIHALLDEVAAFMVSTEYSNEIAVQMYATVLAAFKGMSGESDSAKEQDRLGSDPVVKMFVGTFQLPMAFVNETQAKIVTAAADSSLKKLNKEKDGILNDTRRRELFADAAASKWAEPESKELSDYQHEKIQALLDASAAHFGAEPLFEDDLYDERSKWNAAKSDMEAATRFRQKGEYARAANLEAAALLDVSRAIIYAHRLPSSTAATKIQRSPKVRHIELTYSPKPKTTVDDAARVIRQYRNRSLRQQPNPMFVIVYDRAGKPTGTISLGPQFKNQLLKSMKKGAVDFGNPVSFGDEQDLKAALLPGIPESISVGGMTYAAEAVAGPDMALYHGPADWLVKFPDGRTHMFPGRPTFRNMRRLNFPVPRNRFNWTRVPKEEQPEAGKASNKPEGKKD